MIINSLLDLDLYKLTVGQFIFTHFKNATATYQMTVRNGEKIDYWKYVTQEVFKSEVNNLEALCLKSGEAEYLRSLNLFTEDYILFLTNHPLRDVQRDVNWIYQDGKFGQSIPIAKGLWYKVMLYEIFCLSISNELYARSYAYENKIDIEHILHTARTRLFNKIESLEKYNKTATYPIKIVEFGTRRRLSNKWQEVVIDQLKIANLSTGTSNVMFAQKFNLQAVGSFGHEIVMGMQAIVNPIESQYHTFKLWNEFYGEKSAIALNDTLGTDKFLKDFTKDLANKYIGLRHDSGDPFAWGNQMIAMYEGFGIDPKTKILMFSDGLDINLAIKLNDYFADRIKVAFGIGTNLTNDSFVPVPQVVMKITECNGRPVAKISNNPEKSTCKSPEYLTYLKYAIKNF